MYMSEANVHMESQLKYIAQNNIQQKDTLY